MAESKLFEFSFVRPGVVKRVGSHSADYKYAQMAEWLTHWIANPDLSGCVGSNPALSVCLYI